ncbi:MAG: putative sugar O-methyltransferase [Planctomyces sp.]
MKTAVRRLYRKLKQAVRGLDEKLDPRWVAAKAWGGRVSLSDNDAYPDFCYAAAHDSRLFSTFRTARVYRTILEHITDADAMVCLQELRKCPEVLALLNEFRRNDEVGGPRLLNAGEFGVISGTTLRYAKVAADLHQLFGSLDGQRIFEIGVGYGGQCRVIDACWRVQQYCLVDLRPVLDLAQAYLDRYALRTQIRYSTMNELSTEAPDLLISNYAFSELPRAVQDIYMEKVVLRSPRGYITFNDMNPAEYRSWTVRELCDVIPGARVLPEVPLTYEKNCLIVWG